MRICRVATVPFFVAHHLKSQIKATAAAGHEVVIVSSSGPQLMQFVKELGVQAHPILIRRMVSPISDLRSLIAMYRYFSRERFDIVHSTTPKAGLLCAIAAFLARVPIRLHTFTGQPWARLARPLRWLVKNGDRLIVWLNTRCYADSRSQADFLVSQGVAAPGGIAVLGNGSLGGVDLVQFDPDRWSNRHAEIREELGIPSGAKIITYIGRVTRDKGIGELVAAFKRLIDGGINACLLLVGPFEPERDPLPDEVEEQIRHETRIKAVGYSTEPERYMSVSDVFCLPSYREGFGNVVIEAAAMGVPTVGTRIVGLVDSVVDGETGMLVPPRDVDALTGALSRMLSDESLRTRMGRAAQERARSLYDANVVNQFLLDEYERLRRRPCTEEGKR
ncbi:MAG: glycosyltransferase family 4 protein [Sulfuricaulis sp.]